jgi:subtilisin family serine protease
MQNKIEGRYIVVLKKLEDNLATKAVYAFNKSAFIRKHRLVVNREFDSVLDGMAIQASEAEALAIAEDPEVDFVEEDSIATKATTQSMPTWNLDRIDQRSLPLNDSYIYDQNGTGVHVYVLDSGIRSTHSEFNGRALLNFTAIKDGKGANDCDGHGTFVAGIIGGSTYGVAKASILHSVRVLDCSGSGPVSGVIAGVDWVTKNRIKPAVANVSISANLSKALNDAITRSINSGVVYTVAAGNGGLNACTKSPSSTPSAITVGATYSNDIRPSYSNIGRCIDIFAPGDSIISAFNTSNTDLAIGGGTSAASPHVAGVAALYLQRNRTAGVATVTNVIAMMSTYGKVINRGSGSPNHLLYSRSSTVRRGAFFRYANRRNGDHLYTLSWSELPLNANPSWSYQGVQGYLTFKGVSNTIPLYRYYNKATSSHFYTINFNELKNGVGSWLYQGIVGYAPKLKAADTTNLYRFYNKTNGHHFYTTNINESGGSGTWVYQGIQCQIYKTP